MRILLRLAVAAVFACAVWLWVSFAIDRFNDDSEACYGPDLESYPCDALK